MTPSSFATFVRYKAKADDVSLPDTELLMLANAYKDEIAGKVQERRPEIWNMPFTDNLELDRREYAIPEDMMNRLIYLELDLDNDGKFVRAKRLYQFKENEESLTEEHIINTYNGYPSYYLRRNAIYLLTKAVIAVTGGLRGAYDIFPADLTSLSGVVDMAVNPTTTSFGMPRSLHEIWARRTAIGYKDANGIELSEEDKAFASNLESILDNMAIDIIDSSIIATFNDDSDNSNYGYEN